MCPKIRSAKKCQGEKNFFLPQAQHRKNFFSYPLTFFSGGVKFRVPKGGKRKQATSDPFRTLILTPPDRLTTSSAKTGYFTSGGAKSKHFLFYPFSRIASTAKCVTFRKNASVPLGIVLVRGQPLRPRSETYT